MGMPPRQIGWSNKLILIWHIGKQIEKLTKVAGSNLTPATTTTTTTL
jgi:hypothetical protein